MEGKIYGIFLAGGSGRRMGCETPKQFLEISGIPILQRTIRGCLDAIEDMVVIVVLPKAHIQTWKRLCAEKAFDCPQILVEGGMTRFHSVKAALAKIPDGAEGLVFIHDAVRPFASRNLLLRLKEEGARNPAVIPVVPVTDTLKTTDGSPAPDRSKLLAAQTPQVFHPSVIKDAYRQGYDLSFTDDGSVVSKRGVPLTFVEGERYNIKITTKEDLPLSEFILSLKK